MNKRTRYFFICLLMVASVQAFIEKGLLAQSSADSVIFRAMHDEIERSMHDLEYRDYAKPCYIGFELNNHFEYVIHAELGAIFRSDTLSNRGWSYRLIVGTYEINDENFRGQSNDNNMSMGDLADVFPVENNYWGLRRSIWMKTNDIYLRAGVNHREKLKLIEQGKISKESLTIHDFTRSTPVEISIDRKTDDPSLDVLKEKVRRLSEAYYSNRPNIDYSTASLSYNKNDVYYQNSEGTRFKIPQDLLSLNVTLKKETGNYDFNVRTLSVIAESFDELPSLEQLQQDVEKLVEDFRKKADAIIPENEYTGPVLLVGRIASETLLDNLFDADHSLYAERNDLVVNTQGDVFFEEIQNEWQSKMGKRILPDSTDIMALPALNEFNGVKLMGNYPIDSDGIIPPDSIKLVEDGKLLAMLCSRTPTSVTDISNGHYQFYFTSNGLAHFHGPSVIRIQANKAFSLEGLRQKLIDYAKKEGYDFAYIIRSIPSETANMPYNFYRINVETGEEQLMKNVSLERFIETSEMRKIAFSRDIMVLNTLMNGNRFAIINPNGLPVSYIGPNAIFVEEMNINVVKDLGKLHTAGDYITNPLKR
ncbi:MAG: hypothetical protein JW731_14415 [Bacteroidales bacterium]|nr:hypothetical protein [Bacteroidales bacterium]